MPTSNLTTTTLPATNVYMRYDRMTETQAFALLDFGLILLALGILLIEQRTFKRISARIGQVAKTALTVRRGVVAPPQAIRKTL
jgi:hypothetical protein